MKLADKKIGFAITGSFCTLKHALIMLENLKNTKCDIIPIISENVATLDTRFFQASDFVARVVEITGKQPITTIPAAEPIGPQKLLDMLIIAPCTATVLQKSITALPTRR
jgi:dipicolinate synthase subunit B